MNVFSLTQPVRDRRWLGFAIALAAVAIGCGMRIALGDIALKFPFVIFLPPIIVTAFICGVAPAIFAAVLAGIVADVTMIAPAGHLLPAWPEGWIALGFFALTVTLDILLINAMMAGFRRAGQAEAALRGANEDLERRVSDRTAELWQQIAERESAEAQVRQMQKIESVGQLTGGIAHDFNNMLAVVTGSIEMAKRRAHEPERVADFLGSAEEAATRAAQLVARLLAFSRQQPLEPRILDANQLVAGMSELLRRTIGAQVKVETIQAGGLWRCFADAAQLENAILNLAVNARDAMPDGGVLTIETRNTGLDRRYVRQHPDVAAGDYVAIGVTDTGTGMPPQVIERAFDPFYTTKGVGRGTGLGLSQVYGFIKQSGGHVSIYSEIGKGTSIKLYLPRHDGIIAAPEVGEARPLPMARGEEIVLVVEDEPGVRRISVDALRELGYVVVESSDPQHALTLLETRPRIDLLFTDVVMPGMNGPELAEAARRLRPDLRVIFTTGYASNTVLPNMGVPVVPKPFTLDQLAAKVRDVLDR